jgi:hypothetical protein
MLTAVLQLEIVTMRMWSGGDKQCTIVLLARHSKCTRFCYMAAPSRHDSRAQQQVFCCSAYLATALVLFRFLPLGAASILIIPLYWTLPRIVKLQAAVPAAIAEGAACLLCSILQEASCVAASGT